MSFQRTKTLVSGDYWTIIRCNLIFHPLPDEREGGPKSTILLGLFENKEAYSAGAMPIEIKTYSVSFTKAISVVRSTDKTCEEAAYEIIIAQDNFFSGAETVE